MSAWPVSNMRTGSGWSAMIISKNSTPLTSGIFWSEITTSMGCSCSIRTASDGTVVTWT